MGEGGQGLILTISAKGFNANVDHEVKSQFNFHKDDATLQVFLDDSARRAGLQGITIDPAFAGIVRDYQAGILHRKASQPLFHHLTMLRAACRDTPLLRLAELVAKGAAPPESPC